MLLLSCVPSPSPVSPPDKITPMRLVLVEVPVLELPAGKHWESTPPAACVAHTLQPGWLEHHLPAVLPSWGWRDEVPGYAALMKGCGEMVGVGGRAPGSQP